jgi:hypothetical protein
VRHVSGLRTVYFPGAWGPIATKEGRWKQPYLHPTQQDLLDLGRHGMLELDAGARRAPWSTAWPVFLAALPGQGNPLVFVAAQNGHAPMTTVQGKAPTAARGVVATTPRPHSYKLHPSPQCGPSTRLIVGNPNLHHLDTEAVGSGDGSTSERVVAHGQERLCHLLRPCHAAHHPVITRRHAGNACDAWPLGCLYEKPSGQYLSFICDESLTCRGLNMNSRHFGSFPFILWFMWRITFACLMVCR